MPGFLKKGVDVLNSVPSRKKEQASFASSIWNYESIKYHEFDKNGGKCLKYFQFLILLHAQRINK